MDLQDDILIQGQQEYIPASSALDALGELGRCTTALHEASPDRLAQVRMEYRLAVLKFNGTA